MTKAALEELIDALATNVKPVRRARPPLQRCALWLLLAVFVVAMLGISHGVRPDLVERLQDPIFVLRFAGAITTAMLASMATFLISMPDRSTRWLLLPVPALVLWLSTIGYGCLTDWVRLAPNGIHFGQAAECLATLVLVSTPLSLAKYLMVRHVGPLRPKAVTLVGALSIAAATAAALTLFHPLDATALILFWNLGVAILFLLVGGVFAKSIFPRFST